MKKVQSVKVGLTVSSCSTIILHGAILVQSSESGLSWGDNQFIWVDQAVFLIVGKDGRKGCGIVDVEEGEARSFMLSSCSGEKEDEFLRSPVKQNTNFSTGINTSAHCKNGNGHDNGLYSCLSNKDNGHLRCYSNLQMRTGFHQN